MKIGLRGTVGQSPVALAAIGGFENQSQADLENGGWRQQLGSNSCGQPEAIGSAPKVRFRRNCWNEASIAFAIGKEAICGPLARRRQVEFAVFHAVDCSNEGFAAGVLPKVVGRAGWLRSGARAILLTGMAILYRCGIHNLTGAK